MTRVHLSLQRRVANFQQDIKETLSLVHIRRVWSPWWW